MLVKLTQEMIDRAGIDPEDRGSECPIALACTAAVGEKCVVVNDRVHIYYKNKPRKARILRKVALPFIASEWYHEYDGGIVGGPIEFELPI